MLSGLAGPVAGDSAMADLFSDTALVNAALAFEAALARASAAVGLFETSEADAIIDACETMAIDVESLVNDAHHAGTLAIPLAAHIREAVAHASTAAAERVHFASTSQDLADTIAVLQYRRAARLLIASGHSLADRLAGLAETYADTPMTGRTLLRAARPITFGLKAANWLAPLAGALQRLRVDGDALGLQFGGAAGTMAGIDGHGLEIAQRMAGDLGLPEPQRPWHTDRTSIATLCGSLSLMAATMTKIARDIALLGQDEVAEVLETPEPGRGGSSAMPHKRNATGCQQTLSSLARVPGLAQTLHAQPGAEHERGIAGWQSELGIVSELFVWTHDGVVTLGRTVGQLEIRPEAMRQNLLAHNIGTDTGEAKHLVQRIVRAYQETRHD